jgi:DNA-binding response OmpR family regulator
MNRSAVVEQLARNAITGRQRRVTGPPPAGHSQRGDPPEAPVLVVESDRDLGRTIAEQLDADGYRVQLARTAEHARVLARTSPPRLAVLGNLNCPRGALQLLAEIRDSSRPDAPWDAELPAIVLCPRAQPLDLLRAFEVGADDFLARPARYLELRARLRAVLRRTEAAPRHGRALEVGPLKIDPNAHAVSLHGQPVALRRLEFELLLHLAGDPARVFGRDELLHDVWGYRCSASTRTVDSHASRLRRKLDLDGRRRWVVNVWGVGYRLL